MEDREIIGHLYDIQEYSVHDGPGIRTTVYLKGCPLKCLWCHSPESQTFTDELAYMKLRCVGVEDCGACLRVCQHQAIALCEPEKSVLDDTVYLTKIRVLRDRCTQCMECAKACNAEALFCDGYDMTVGEVFARVMKDKLFFGEDGGVTISGGEAMSQPEFTYALAKMCKEAGISVCLDTTGYCSFELLEKMIPVTDLFLYDLKHMDSAKHKSFTGVPNELILENARRLAAAGGKLQVRVPVIPKLNGGMENIRATAAFCKELGDAVTLVQVLPYHRMGIAKYERLDLPYRLVNVDPPEDEYMNARLQVMLDAGLKAQLH